MSVERTRKLHAFKPIPGVVHCRAFVPRLHNPANVQKMYLKYTC